MIIIDDIDQRSQEWYRIWAGITSASEFSWIVIDNGEHSKSQIKYIYLQVFRVLDCLMGGIQRQ